MIPDLGICHRFDHKKKKKNKQTDKNPQMALILIEFSRGDGKQELQLNRLELLWGKPRVL